MGGFSFSGDKFFATIENGSAAVSDNVQIVGSSMYVSSGGTANQNTVKLDGHMTVSQGGTANDTTVNYNGSMTVSSGGTATNIVAATGAWLHITVAPDTFIRGTSGSAFEMMDASITNFTVDCSMTVSSGGTANDTTVNYSGSMTVSSGGTANDTIVNSGGRLYVSSGGTATVVYNPWQGVIASLAGADVTYLAPDANIYYGNYASGILSKYDSLENFEITSKNSVVILGGTANSTIVSRGGNLYVSSGGTANRTALYSGGFLTVYHGGTANKTTFNFGGHLYVSSGGTANETTVNYNGSMTVFSGGTALNVVWTPCVGRVDVKDGGTVTYASSYSGVYLGSAGTLRSSGGVMTGETLNGHSMYVMNGGTANSTIVSRGGGLYVSSGGTANRTALYSGGFLTVYRGGTANKTTVNSGSVMNVSSGGTANETTIVRHAEMFVCGGGTANKTTVNSDCVMEIWSGGTANDTTVNEWGYMIVCSGGTANDITVNFGGHLYVSSGGTALLAYDPWDVRRGTIASATGATITSFVYPVYYGNSVEGLISRGRTLTRLSVNSGFCVLVKSGGTANSTTVNSGGCLYVSSGGTATGIAAAIGARLDITIASNTHIQGTSCGSAFEMKDAAITSFTVNTGGAMYVESGGTAQKTTVKPGGRLYVSSGGTASDTVISGGSMRIAPEGAHRGFLQIASGAVVSAEAGAKVDFTISGRTAEDDYLINDLSLISGTPTFTITIADEQAFGTYKLARGAASFAGSITVKSDTVEYGTVVCNSVALQTETLMFLLKTVDTGNLILTISAPDHTPPEAPTTSANITIPTSTNVSVSATFSEDSAQKQYSLDNRTWQNYTTGVEMRSNGTVWFRGIDAAGNISDIASYAVTNIDKVAPDKPTASADVTAPTNGNVTVGAIFSNDSAQKQYSLDGENFLSYENGVVMSSNGTVYFRGIDTAGNISDVTSYAVTNIDLSIPGDLAGDAAGVNWTSQADGFVVEYSSDNFGHGLRLETATNALDTFNMPQGTCRWRVRAEGTDWVEGGNIAAPASGAGAQLFVSDADGNTDLFFARKSGMWDNMYYAELSAADGRETERIELNGKNRLADVFEGSADANVLVLTDDANGDALFLDDIYTPFPEAEQRGRVAQIHEIHAGAGDDIVDLTSQRFDYEGSDMTVRGGLGDDTVWANSGENKLFGDAGNDRLAGASGDDVLVGGTGNDSMQGGGGDDIFTFGANWGIDTVEQLAGGSVTLWFQSDFGSWNAQTLTYTDGINSVTVSGVAADRITLKFGDDGTGQYATFAKLGAFADATSEKIFEDANKGMLA